MRAEEGEGGAILEVRGVAKSFGGVRALRGVDLRVARGEALGVIGPNGSGKTTLINCITGFLRPDRGRVVFEGRDITGLAPHRVADLGLARTFQVMRPFHELAAWENLVVALASPRARRQGGWRGGGRHGDRDAVALDILEDLGFERESRAPFQRAGALPTGYMKRLELARCIALGPELIVCDELFSGLSPAESAGILPILERLLAQGAALIMVEHRLRELFRVAGRVLAMAQGEKLAEGAPREVLDHPAVRAAYLGAEGDAP